MKKKLPDNQITVYQTSDGKINIEVLYANENIWLPQKRMAELFGCSADNISLHLKNIYKDKELEVSATAEDFSVVQTEGSREVTRTITCYSLEAIIAVGYRVNSERGTQFRIWANNVLKEYLVKGYALNEKRLSERATNKEQWTFLEFMRAEITFFLHGEVFFHLPFPLMGDPNC
jgi:hypothetical protein